MCVFGFGLICIVCWARKSSRISYYKPRIIYVQLSDNPYSPDFANTISYTASVYNRIQIIHICVDIKNSSPYPQNLDSDQIGCGNYPLHFHPWFLGSAARWHGDSCKTTNKRITTRTPGTQKRTSFCSKTST
jgi:hypothetical protein